MRILFDGYWWLEGPFANRQIARELVFAWIREYPDDDVGVAIRRSQIPEVRRELGERIALMPTRLSPQGISAMLELPVLGRRHRADVVFAHNFTPLWGRSAVFIQDFIFCTNPDWFTRKERLYFPLMPASKRRARWVFSSTATESARLDRFGGIRRASIPVGLGLPPGVTQAAPTPPEHLRELDRFLLLVGRLNRRKNLRIALEAALASPEISRASPVVVVGEPAGRATQMSRDILDAADNGRVKFTGFISDAELAWLYQRAALLLFLSRDEGFGLPNLEAMHFGTPVLASDIPVFREVLGDYATYVDPTDRAAITTQIDLQLQISNRPDAQTPDRYTWESVVHRIRESITS